MSEFEINIDVNKNKRKVLIIILAVVALIVMTTAFLIYMILGTTPNIKAESMMHMSTQNSPNCSLNSRSLCVL